LLGLRNFISAPQAVALLSHLCSLVGCETTKVVEQNCIIASRNVSNQLLKTLELPETWIFDCFGPLLESLFWDTSIDMNAIVHVWMFLVPQKNPKATYYAIVVQIAINGIL